MKDSIFIGIVFGLIVILAVMLIGDYRKNSDVPVRESSWDKAMLKAIYLAEGGKQSAVPYGVLSVKCETKEECRAVCLQSIRNNLWRFLEATEQIEDFIKFMGMRYAPPRSHPLNRYWVKNVIKLYEKGKR